MNECRSIETLLEGAANSTLSGPQAQAVAEHLRTCRSCAEALGAFTKLAERRSVRPVLPDAYWTSLLPRLRERIDARRPFVLPAFVLRFVSPAVAALFLLAMVAELVPTGPGSAPGDAAMLLRSLPEAELASVAQRHDLESPIMLPAEVAENITADLEESSLLQEIVDTETNVNLYAYVDTDAAAGDLAEADQAQLVSMLQRP